MGLTGIVGTLMRSYLAIHFVYMAYHFFFFSAIVCFLCEVIQWQLALKGMTTNDRLPWVPNETDRRNMIFRGLAFASLLVSTVVFVRGTFQSLKNVFAVGGDGWEGAHYEILLEHSTKTNIEK